MTDKELLRQIERAPGQRVGYKHLVRIFGLGGGRERRLLLEQLAKLTAAGRLVKVDREQWALAGAAKQGENLVAGRLDMHRDGYGFVRPNDAAAAAGGDIFIPPNEISTAMQGDQVLVEVFPKRPGDDRQAGRVVRVLTRSNPTVVGTFHYGDVDGESHGRRHVRRGKYGIPREPRVDGHYVKPFDERMSGVVVIPYDEPLPEGAQESVHRVLGEEARRASVYEDLEGLVVDVEITEWPTATRPALGRVLEVLGEEDAFGVDVEMMIRKHHLPRIFPENVLAEARKVARLDEQVVAERRDFRGLKIVTIDGETARDFDDAVLAREQADGSWELQVHIADVAQYVRPGGGLDLEARLRGTSVYFPDRAVPMLPQELSTDICSLKPKEDRLVLSCLMRIDSHGVVLGYEVTEGVICSARRLTYTQVQGMIDGDAAVRAECADVVAEVDGMYRLAQILNKKRERRGSIDFDLPEPVIEFDEAGMMQGVTRAERGWSNRLIEEFMLAANECVASWLEHLEAPSLYRIHEKPEARKVVEFEEVAASFGYSLGVGNLPVKQIRTRGERRDARGQGKAARVHEVAEEIAVSPRMYQKLAEKIAGKPEERIVAYLMLRSLKQARYSEKNEGHFALAAPTYTHFTSPIRRYPDLIVHRVAKALLAAGVDGHGVVAAGDPHGPSARHGKLPDARAKGMAREAAPLDEVELQAIAQETSDTERRAAEAERELMEWKKLKFMRDRVGEDFDAMILSATKYGLFVELNDLFVEGLVPLQTLGALDGDFYTYRENTREIIGEHWGRKFRIGQPVRVLLDRVDAVEKRLQFSILLDEDETAKGLAQRKANKKDGGKKKRRREVTEEKAKSARPAKAANPKKSGRRTKKFSQDAVPEFAKRVAQPPPRGHKKGKKKK
jgi:ribonuclease R